MRQRLTAISASLLVALTVVACSDDSDPPPARSGPSALTEVDGDPAAASAVSEALAALRSGNSGTFTARLQYAGTTHDHHGSYRLQPPQQRVSFVADATGDPEGTEAVAAGGGFFVRLPSEGPVSSDCWVSGDAAQLAEVTGLETDPATHRIPGVLQLAATAEGVAFAEGSDDVLGSVDLATALGLVRPRLPALLGVSVGQARVLTRFALDSGVLTGVRVDGPAILAALEAVGTAADPTELADVFSAETPVEATLSDSGAQVVIEPPPPSTVIALSAADAQQRLESCE